MANPLTIIPASSCSSCDSTTPSTPPSTTSSIFIATTSSKRCTYLFCPVNHPHDRGLYLHSSRTALSHGSRRIFGRSIPPPHVVAAYERCSSGEGIKTDEELWVTFHELHVEPLLENMDTAWIAPVPMRLCDDDSVADKCADPYGAENDGGAGRFRHPFGMFNPPEQVWEAHRRLVLDLGDLGDQELVDTFAAKKAYDGEGLGLYESMSRRFQVRRPRYSMTLAKERRVKKELASRQHRS